MTLTILLILLLVFVLLARALSHVIFSIIRLILMVLVIIVLVWYFLKWINPFDSSEPKATQSCSSVIKEFNDKQTAVIKQRAHAAKVRGTPKYRPAMREVVATDRRIAYLKDQLGPPPRGRNCAQGIPLPNASFTATTNPDNLRVTFDASASKGEGELQYQWDWDDPNRSDYSVTTKPVVTWPYTASGSWLPQLRVIDSLGRSATYTLPHKLIVPRQTCEKTWTLSTADHQNNRLIAAGLTSIQDATTKAEARAAAQDWVDTVRTDPINLTAASAYFLGKEFQPNDFVDQLGVCASDLAATIGSQLEFAVANARSVKPAQAPLAGINSGVDNGHVVQAPKPGISGDRTAIEVVLRDGKKVWIMARSGNPVTLSGVSLPTGRTDNL